MSNVAESNERGFTLLEVLVALAIAGAGLVAVLKTAGTGVEVVQTTAQTVAAVRHAEGRLAELGVTVPLKPGEAGGVESDGYRWHVRVSTVHAHPAAGDVAARALYAVESVVTWKAGGRERSVRLDSVRTGQPPGQSPGKERPNP